MVDALSLEDLLRNVRLYEESLREGGAHPRGSGRDRNVQLDTGRQKRLARLLLAQLVSDHFEFDPCRPYVARLEGKTRTLYRFTPVDRAVHFVVARALTHSFESIWPTTLYSYRRGWSQFRALADFATHVRTHRQGRPPTSRGLYVLRRDIRNYGDSIPVTDDSPLWTLLRATLQQASGNAPSPSMERLLREIIRPLVQLGDATPVRLLCGVPTGSPIQPLICNLYLHELDVALGMVPGGFFARFGDDMLFAHPEAGVARDAARTIDTVCARLGLEINQTKAQDLYFNGSGRRSPAWPEARSATMVEYLGLRLDFHGRIGLKRAKARLLLADIDARLRNSSRILRRAAASETEIGRVLCGVINRVLDPSDPLAHPLASDLLTVVDDRAQLRALDYELARRIAETLSGHRGARAFRAVPYRMLRRTWGLVSLEHRRNRP